MNIGIGTLTFNSSSTVDFKSNILLMSITGVTATIAFLFLFTAYSIASPSVISPFEYSILFWSPLIGWLFFDEIPTVWTITGAMLIMLGVVINAWPTRQP